MNCVILRSFSCMFALMLLASSWAASPARAQAPLPPVPEPTREFRGVWVATVANIDWPSQRGLPAEKLKAEMNTILDAAQATGLNAIVLQVRPACDAIYRSELEPWSEFLTGESGVAPKGLTEGEDPLQWWIDGARARGLELHAWFNPFRARHFDSEKPDAANHISNARPELVRTYGQFKWLDPGEPAAQDHAMRVLLDVVRRYDLDGIHVDDYFYPYPDRNQPFPDDLSFASHGQRGQTREEWRRANIDRFVERMWREVKAEKPWVRVGISPFGIWRPGFPAGVQGFDAFQNLSADARKWLREGWCDYMSPQLYWKAEAPKQPFDRLLTWWLDQNDQQRHVWPGLYATRILAQDAEDKEGRSWAPSDILRQIEITRATPPAERSAHGMILFSMVGITQNRRGLADELRARAFRDRALAPAIPWSVPTNAGPVPKVEQIWGGVAGSLRAGLSGGAKVGTPGGPRVIGWVLEGDAWSFRGVLPEGEIASAEAGRTWALAVVDAFGRAGPARIVRAGTLIAE
jgi:uncharacterized lipoprotein YddW (UPF0748 family)